MYYGFTIKEARERLALNGRNFAPFVLIPRMLGTSQFQNGWSYVHCRQQLLVNDTGSLHAGAIDDCRNTNAAFGRKSFPHFVWRRACLSPVTTF